MYYFSLALLDSLNPASISLLIVLLPLVKKTSHISYYIGGAFLTYFLIGLVFFYGIDQYLEHLILGWIKNNAVISSIIGLTLGIMLLIIGMFLTIKIIRSFKQILHEKPSPNYPSVKSVHPLILLGLSISSTLSDAPTSLPYIFFIGRLAQVNDPFIIMFFQILIYCAIYIMPLLLLYVAFKSIQRKFHAIETWTKNAIRLLSKYGLPVVAFALGFWLIYISL